MNGFLVVTLIVTYMLAVLLATGKSYIVGYKKGINDGVEIADRIFDYYRAQSFNEYNKGEINNGK